MSGESISTNWLGSTSFRVWGVGVLAIAQRCRRSRKGVGRRDNLVTGGGIVDGDVEAVGLSCKVEALAVNVPLEERMALLKGAVGLECLLAPEAPRL